MTSLLLIFALLCWAAPAAAQSKSGDKEWNTLVEAAKKEGKVVVAGSPDPVMRNEIIPKFKERFGVNVEFLAGRADVERGRRVLALTPARPGRVADRDRSRAWRP